jgi:hypothetical protein
MNTHMSPLQKHRLEALCVGFGALSLFAALWVTFKSGRLPGDLGDTRFNQIILEHGFNWLCGRVEHFWDSFFFYPAQNVIAYSDAHLGTLPIYALVRWTGLHQDFALLWWFQICCAASMASCHFALRRLNIAFLPALCGAFVFAFSIPVLAQFNHIQLMPRFFIPPAFLCLLRLLELRQVRYWYGLLACVIAQTYCSIYEGYFLAICLLATALFPLFRIWRTRTTRPWTLRVRLPLIIGTGLLAATLLPLAIPYIRASSAVGVRNWKEISTMLPRVTSYFHAPDSLIWGALLNSEDSLPMQHEHVLFLGLLPLLALGALTVRAFTSRVESTETKQDRLMLTGFFLAVLLTLYWAGFSPYRLVAMAPGASSIRAVSRIILILLFPAAYALGRVMTLGLECVRGPAAARTIIGIVLAICCVVDQRAGIASYSMEKSRLEVEQVKTAMRQSDKTIFWVHSFTPGKPDFLMHLSAMLAAQELGVSLVNGYTGNIPPGYPWDLWMLGPKSCAGFTTWIDDNKAAFDGRTVHIIGEPPCALTGR